MENHARKLASIRRVAEIRPIEEADAIEHIRVDGWWVVGKKNEFRVGELVVYFELDSWIPHELAPFLSKGKEPREYNGVKGERLRTVKLRGAISQGLLIRTVGERDYINYVSKGNGQIVTVYEGTDVTEFFGIQKWEPVIPAQLAGVMSGNFPTHLVPKTDQERVQNIDFSDTETFRPTDKWEVTVKLDGSSATFIVDNAELRVCSRNLELKVDESNADNTYVKMGLEFFNDCVNPNLNIVNGLAFQGEIWGDGMQGNSEKAPAGKRFFSVFDVYDTVNQRYLTSQERLTLLNLIGATSVPVLFLEAEVPYDVDALLSMADGPSVFSNNREGLVFKNLRDPSVSFKAISNRWLMANNG
jgi:RNA ligase (TIGR02306 family)